MQLRIVPGSLRDFERVMKFYARERSDELPTPTAKDLATALEDGRLLFVEDQENQILATAAYIPITARSCLTVVGELTGTRVTDALNRGKPLNFQTLLLGLRVLHHIAYEGEPIPPGSYSIITIVKKTNEPSYKNIVKSKFVEFKERPEWLRFDELSWHGKYVEDDWRYFYATSETVQHLANQLISNGLLSWNMNLEVRAGRASIHFEGFRSIAAAAPDLIAFSSGARKAKIVPPPQSLLFP
jgi:hypothetical protein